MAWRSGEKCILGYIYLFIIFVIHLVLLLHRVARMVLRGQLEDDRPVSVK